MINVTFDLNNGTYKPYTKPNNEIKYIKTQITLQVSFAKIPLSIESRLSAYLITKKYFRKH